ncbi:hypothetical protein [Corynebacterium diphtheriae]|uniref:hypothetical protein n=1 Tax=Corynebacterium diphtheriae TaxID=1717 RepID=UPI000245B0C9|nr:hypothetical protein [Corynebacterium diphtheriae]AEX46247.1 hypothetical protein CDB402_0940 [Corynebacterium diphtheriae INCA 402]
MALRGVGRFHNHGLARIGWDWLALVGAPPPLTPEKDGTSHQIQPNGRFGNDLV